MRVAIILIAITVCLVVFVTPQLLHRQRLAAREALVEHKLQALQGEGRLTLPEGLAKAEFSIPQKSFFYGGGFTYGQLRQELAKQSAVGTADLERRVHFNEYVQYVANAFASGTSYERKISINEPPKPGYLNIYFARNPQSHRESAPQALECSYLGFADAITCDADTIERAFAEIDGISSNKSVVIAVLEPDRQLHVNLEGNLDVVRRLLKQNLLIWVVGHEIGHAIRDREWILSHDTPLHFDGVYNDREAGADAYVAQVVLKDQLLGANFATLLMEFINQQFQYDYVLQHGHAPDLIPGKNPTPLDIHTGRFSRPILLRAVQVMVQVLKRDPSAMDRADYTVVGGRIAYLHSIQFAEQVGLFQSNMRVSTTPDGLRFVAPIVLGGAVLGLGCVVWMLRQAKEKQ